MKRAAALAVCLAAVWVTVHAVRDQPLAPEATALALGFALLAAPLTGALFERLKLPRVSGYLAFGLICGPYLANIITRPMARELRLVNGIAVALIAFVAGLELNYHRMRPRLAAIARLGAATIGLMYVSLVPVFWLALPWMSFLPQLDGVQRLALATVLTTVVVSFSPTVTIAVIADTRARGPFSELVLAVVILADLALVLAFTFALQFARAAFDMDPGAQVGLAPRVLWEIVGSFAFGAAIGAVFALYMRFVGRELTLVLLATCVVLSELSLQLHVEPLLAALAAGLVVENIATPSGDALREAVERGALPVLVVFFAAAGASLPLDTLAAIGGMALAVSVARLVAIRASTAAAARWAGVDPPAHMVWMGLVSQGGVTLGLAVIMAREFPDWGPPVQALIIATSGLHALVGPILFRAALARAGEIGRMDEQPDGT